MTDHCLIQPTRSPSSDLCGILTQLSLRLARDFAQSNKKKNRAIPPGTHDLISLYKFWSGRRVSNSRPQPWQGCALPTELLPHQNFNFVFGGAKRNRTAVNGFAIRCITTLLSRQHSGAGDESRTRDLNLGKVALYQLSYSRNEECEFYRVY